MRSKSHAVNLSQTLTLDNRTFFGLFTAHEFADQSLGDMLRWAEYGARLYKWSRQNFDKPVLETDETMPEREELVGKIEESVDKIEEKTEQVIEEERLSPDLLAAIERAEKAYAEKEAQKETMPIAVPFAQFPYKRTYCGVEMEYLAPKPSPQAAADAPQADADPPAVDPPAADSPDMNKENLSPCKKARMSYIA